MEYDANAIEWLLRALTRMHHYYIDREMEKRGLGFSGFPPILFVLHNELKGRLASQKELADFLGIRPSSITASIKRMEKAGLVEKVHDEGDLRRNIITLTKKGRELVENSLHVFDEVDRRMYEGFSDEEKEQLKTYYLRIIRNLENLGVQSPAGFTKE